MLELLNSPVLALGIAVFASGLVSGFLAGLFGIGGGAVIVPVLYQALTILDIDPAVRMHLAVGTSIGVILPTSIRSFLAHKKRGAADLSLLKSFTVPVPVGVILASIVAASVTDATLRGIFAGIAIAVSLRLLFGRESWRLGSDIPGNPLRAAIGGLIGFFSTLMGIGGGVINNTFMTLFGRPIHQAVATSAGVGVLIAVPGVFGYMLAGWGDPRLPPLSLGFVNLIGVAILVPATIFVAPLGVRFAHALSRRQLEVGFGLFLALVGLRFLYSLL